MIIAFLLCVIPATIIAVRMGRRVGQVGRVQAFALFWLALLPTLGLLILRNYPVWEQHLLFWDGYIFARDILHLPFIGILYGLGRERVDVRSWRSVRLLFAMMALLALFNLRWMGYAMQYAPLSPQPDRFGLMSNSYHDTTGAAACATVLGYFGIHASEGDMAVMTVTRPYEDASPIGIVRALRLMLDQSDCTVTLVKPQWHELATLNAPSIALLNRPGHGRNAVVVYGANAQHIMIGDPRELGGVLCLPRVDFLESWSGLLIEVRTPPYFTIQYPTQPRWI